MSKLRKKTLANLIGCEVDSELILQMEKFHVSEKGWPFLQNVFDWLSLRVFELKDKIQKQEAQIKIKDEVISKLQRYIVRINEEEDRGSMLSREQKIWRLRVQGFSVREIAREMGISKSRVMQILQGVHPLDSLDDQWVVGAIQRGIISDEDRNRKIKEWWEQGHTQNSIALALKMTQGRVSQIILETCTCVQNANIRKEKISKKAKKNGFHRNTQSKIEQIREVNPRLAKKCEEREVSVGKAYKESLPDLIRLGIKRFKN